MSRSVSMRLALAALIVAAVIPLTARAQSQDSQTQSVADAARRAREQKKAASRQPAPVITDDTLKPSAPAAQGANAPDAAPAPSAQPAADSSSAPETNAAPAPGSPAENADKKTKDSAEVAREKQQLAEAQKEFDLIQRELSL